MRKLKKTIIFLLIALYSLGINPVPYAYAQEASPEPSPEQTVVVESSPVPESSPEPQSSPSPESSPSPDPNPSPTAEPSPVPSPEPSPVTAADPSPSPSPDASLLPSPDPAGATLSSEETQLNPSPSPDPCVTDCPPVEAGQTNTGDLANEATSSANTGGNTAGSPEATGVASPQQDPEGSSSPSPLNGTGTTIPIVDDDEVSTIETDKAVAQLDVVNIANTNVTDIPEFEIQNIFSEFNGDIVFMDPASIPDPNTLIVNQQNDANVKNLLTAMANSGYNLVGGAVGTITTGAAYAIVNVFNFVNTNIADSTLTFAIINIFGTLNGNIVLPNPVSGSAPSSLAANTAQENNATVDNKVDQTADTGGNTIVGEEDNSIETGDAMAVTNLQNFANLNILGGSFYHLIVNNFGNWAGQFLGWGSLGPSVLGYGSSVISLGGPGSSSVDGILSANQVNNASVENIITASATTGNNTVGPDGGLIKTGNAFSSVNIVNFLNTNIIASHGFFGIINIFGNFNGDIGDATHFAVNDDSGNGANNGDKTGGDDKKDGEGQVRASGGNLSTSISTNVGTHVNPGDTVMFFITVHNTGNAPVYDGALNFNLYDPSGGLGAVESFGLGEIRANERVYISFGLVLSGEAPGGNYRAAVQAIGKVGPDDSTISSSSGTAFRVSGFLTSAQAFPQDPSGGEIAGITSDEPQTPFASGYQGGIYYAQNWWIILAILLILSYGYGLHSIYRVPYKRLEADKN